MPKAKFSARLLSNPSPSRATSITASPEQAVRWLLLTSPRVARYAHMGVHPMLAAPGDQFPFIVYTRSQGERTPQITLGASVAPQESIEVTVYATSYSEARELADAVRSVLDGYCGDVGGVTIDGIIPNGETEDYVSFGGEQIASAYQVTLTFTVQWNIV
jgi:hypothetical protein